MGVGWCSAADAAAAATARAAAGKTVVALGPADAVGKPDDRARNEAEGSLHTQRRDFTPDGVTVQTTSQRSTRLRGRGLFLNAAARNGVLPPTPGDRPARAEEIGKAAPDHGDEGRKRGRRCRFSTAALQRPLQ